MAQVERLDGRVLTKPSLFLVFKRLPVIKFKPGRMVQQIRVNRSSRMLDFVFGTKVTKIDDNGFVSFVMSPEISAVVGTGENIPGCGPIKRMIRRRLDTGNLRVRAGQTLILTGVISETDQEIVRKWPILGDIPIIGQFFRNRAGSRQKNELVIMVTPQIIDDTQGGIYGYGYTPSRQAATYLPN